MGLERTLLTDLIKASQALRFGKTDRVKLASSLM